MPVIGVLVAFGLVLFSMGVTGPGSARLIKIYGRLIVDENDTSIPKPVPDFLLDVTVYGYIPLVQYGNLPIKQKIGTVKARTDNSGAFECFIEIPYEEEKYRMDIYVFGTAELKRSQVRYLVVGSKRLFRTYSDKNIYEIYPEVSQQYSPPSTGLEIPFIMSGRVSAVLADEGLELAVENARVKVSILNSSGELESGYNLSNFRIPDSTDFRKIPIYK